MSTFCLAAWCCLAGIAVGQTPWHDKLDEWIVELDRTQARGATREIRQQAGDEIERLRENPDQLTDEEFARHRDRLTKAAENGIFPAAMLLGERQRAAGDAEGAFKWFEMAATRGYPPAMIQAGLMYSNGNGVARDLEKASAWLRPANVKGSAVGKYLLAECFLYGKGVERNPKLAVNLLKEAAGMERPGRALDLLATCHHRGWGVEANAEKAANLYEDACEEGFQNACANLAVLLMKGDGVSEDPRRAVTLLKRGAAQENAMCMFFLAAAQLDGLGGLERDEAAAREGFRRAALKGNAEAVEWCRENGVELSRL